MKYVHVGQFPFNLTPLRYVETAQFRVNLQLVYITKERKQVLEQC